MRATVALFLAPSAPSAPHPSPVAPRQSSCPPGAHCPALVCKVPTERHACPVSVMVYSSSARGAAPYLFLFLKILHPPEGPKKPLWVRRACPVRCKLKDEGQCGGGTRGRGGSGRTHARNARSQVQDIRVPTEWSEHGLRLWGGPFARSTVLAPAAGAMSACGPAPWRVGSVSAERQGREGTRIPTGTRRF